MILAMFSTVCSILDDVGTRGNGMTSQLSDGQEWISDTIIIGRQTIEVKTGMVEQAQLLFYPENPRVYSVVHGDGDVLEQHEIESALGDQEHVKQLISAIRSNGGLTDPVIVQQGTNYVLEGNRRLAAYRVLAQNDPIRWGKIKATLLPQDTREDLIFRLLAQYHIVGKKEWAPYEQAGVFWRRSQLGESVKTMAEQVGFTASHVQKLINVYSFMVQHEDTSIDNWSYYFTYFTNKQVQKARVSYPNMDEVIVEKVRSGDIARAVDLRDDLPKIVQSQRALRLLLSSEETFEDAREMVADRTDLYRAINRFRQKIAGREFEGELTSLSEDQRNKCLYELKKIQKRTDALLKRVV